MILSAKVVGKDGVLTWWELVNLTVLVPAPWGGLTSKQRRLLLVVMSLLCTNITPSHWKEKKKSTNQAKGFDCTGQQKDDYLTYHLIDKGNEAEDKYDLSTELHLHGWTPKLAARHFNMNINNAYKVNCYLFKKYHPGQVVIPLKECIHNLTHSLLQQGAPMRKIGCGVSPKATKDITIPLLLWMGEQSGRIQFDNHTYRKQVQRNACTGASLSSISERSGQILLAHLLTKQRH